ncbi:secreted protein [Apilactobacillus ozensis DSM 23829 = JCM 17196]|uniref:Secreted protein n=1 Tax=Apilactobacillus ozensis DSM 23829 = JCM 17196 TaxID=1423781 RepID=A0A0R2AMT0_9LACO|nr:secreted protein [Apilactobacillus ozensis DSM 23829 = JCM 17196]
MILIKAADVKINKAPPVSGPAIDKQFNINKYVNDKSSSEFNQSTSYGNVQIIADGTAASKQSLWFNNKVNLKYKFSNDFYIYIDSDSPTVGDGLTFTMQNDSFSAIGVNGESLGSYGTFRESNYSKYIKRAVSLEFDNYINSDYSDAQLGISSIKGSHIAIVYPNEFLKNNDYKSSLPRESRNHFYIPHYDAIPFSVNRGNWVPVSIQWTPKFKDNNPNYLTGGDFKAIYNGESVGSGKYIPIGQFTGKNSDSNNGTVKDVDVYWGFTGATGEQTMIAAIAYGKLPQVPYITLQYRKNESGDYYIDGTTVNNKKMPPLSLSYGDTVEFKLAISNNPNNGLGKNLENPQVRNFIEQLKADGIQITTLSPIPNIPVDASSEPSVVYLKGFVNKNYTAEKKYHADIYYSIDGKNYVSPSNSLNVNYIQRKLLLTNSIQNVTNPNPDDTSNSLKKVFPGNSKNSNGDVIKFNFSISNDGKIPGLNNVNVTQPVPAFFNTDNIYISYENGNMQKLMPNQYTVTTKGKFKFINIKNISMNNKNKINFSIQGRFSNNGPVVNDGSSYTPYINKNGTSISDDINGLGDTMEFSDDYRNRINILSKSSLKNLGYKDSKDTDTELYNVFPGNSDSTGDSIEYKTLITNTKDSVSSISNLNYFMAIPDNFNVSEVKIDSSDVKYSIVKENETKNILVKGLSFDNSNQSKVLTIKGNFDSVENFSYNSNFSTSSKILLDGDYENILSQSNIIKMGFTDNSLNFSVDDLNFGLHSHLYANQIINSTNDDSNPYVEFEDRRRQKNAFSLSLKQESPYFDDENSNADFEGHLLYNNQDLTLGYTNYANYAKNKSAENIYIDKKPIKLKVYSNYNVQGNYKTVVNWKIKNGF